MDKTLSDLELDETEPWYHASERDHFNLNRKLMRMGCRPLKRQLLECQQSARSSGAAPATCEKLRSDYTQCAQVLSYLQATLTDLDLQSFDELPKSS